MSLNTSRVRHYLKEFKFEKLFIEELGWDHPGGDFVVEVDGRALSLRGLAQNLRGLAQKRGVQIILCEPKEGDSFPDYPTRRKIEKQVTKTAYEHLLIFVDQPKNLQIWQWVSRQPGQPVACREHRYDAASQNGDSLIQKLDAINFPISEEEGLTLPGVTFSLRDAFDRDRLTKRFYELFKKEHSALVEFVSGIEQQGDREWYAALMLNRLMFVYFIQRKAFLDGDRNYLRNRLEAIRKLQGPNKFQSFYRYFLLRLFHEGLSLQPEQRGTDLDQLIGKVPYLNGGLFEPHDLEATNSSIDIPDEAFERLFDFFDQYDWHLDARPLQSDREINPDVLGYIFEKYINQKQMGAYYTKEDITGYIGKNTIVPFLLDAAAKDCAIAFEPEGSVWSLLRKDPDRYLYPAVLKGVIDEHGEVIPLPEEIARGIDDVGQRGGWNRPADPGYALPAETWREHVARRQRCLEIRDLFADGKVHTVSDLITYNLDIRQFAEDVISECEGPELLRAFFKALSTVTVLDPTCGSGAFLFAALNILDPLYEACLVRMEGFVDDLDRSEVHHRPEKFRDFRQILAEVEKHPSRSYFILKSIIVNNLYGVDIMAEAVEICKLRLFLKLVSQVDKVDQLEPLPDIDFNIRAGNTFVGFVTLADVRRAAEVEADVSRQGRLIFGETEDALQRLEEDAEIVDRAFQQFHEMQTRHEMDVGEFVTAKQELRSRLQSLAAELDRYMAAEYGIDHKDAAAFDAWRSSHQPFHWFAEFYGIMSRGGFDVIIGNPPYVEYSKIRSTYVIRDFRTLQCGNIYAPIFERCHQLLGHRTRLGLILPLSLLCTGRMAPARWLLAEACSWVVAYDMRPSSLFEGVAQRLCIVLQERPTQQSDVLFVGGYRRWGSSEREVLIPLTHYCPADRPGLDSRVPKISSSIENTILEKTCGTSVEAGVDESAGPVFVHRICRYFIKAVDFIPYYRDPEGRESKSEDYKPFHFENELKNAILCLVNSSLFYWYWRTFGDGFHCGYRDVYLMSVPRSIWKEDLTIFDSLSRELMGALDANSERKVISTARGQIEYQEFHPAATKATVDKIDHEWARLLSIGDQGLDFIINYDIKYRMGLDRLSGNGSPSTDAGTQP